MNDPLSQLRDIHLPEPVSWWPPAPGWWFLLIVLIGTIVFAVWRHIRQQRIRFIKDALNELHNIEQMHNKTQDNRQLVQNVSSLLRRVCITRYSREKVAALTGEEWLKLLDRNLGQPEFSRRFAETLLSAPYRANPEVETKALLATCKRWINALPQT